MKLGKTQEGVLEALKEHGGWHASSRWLWDTPSNTKRVLDSLVKRGLVTIVQTTDGTDVYLPVE